MGDIYSLGVLLYQLLTGKLPHDTPAQVQRHAPFKLPTEINSSIHTDLEQVVLTCLQKRAEDRFSTISDLIHAFDSAATKQLKVGAIAPVFKLNLLRTGQVRYLKQCPINLTKKLLN